MEKMRKKIVNVTDFIVFISFKSLIVLIQFLFCFFLIGLISYKAGAVIGLFSAAFLIAYMNQRRPAKR